MQPIAFYHQVKNLILLMILKKMTINQNFDTQYPLSFFKIPTVTVFLSYWHPSSYKILEKLMSSLSWDILRRTDGPIDYLICWYFVGRKWRKFHPTINSPGKVSPSKIITICLNDFFPLRFLCTSSKDTYFFGTISFGESEEYFFWWRKSRWMNSFARRKFHPTKFAW